jgi:hypothetical protein
MAMTIATALLVLGCSGDPKSDDAVPSTTPSAPTPRLVESLSAAAYKKLLSQIDASLARDVAKVMKAPNMTAFDKARADLEASVAAQRAVLEKVRGPADYNGHPAVLAAFDVFSVEHDPERIGSRDDQDCLRVAQADDGPAVPSEERHPVVDRPTDHVGEQGGRPGSPVRREHDTAGSESTTVDERTGYERPGYPTLRASRQQHPADEQHEWHGRRGSRHAERPEQPEMSIYVSSSTEVDGIRGGSYWVYSNRALAGTS